MKAPVCLGFLFSAALFIGKEGRKEGREKAVYDDIAGTRAKCNPGVAQTR